MKKFFVVSAFILSGHFAAYSQNQPTALCPNVEMTTPNGGNTGRGERLAIAAMVNTDNWQTLQYQWKISPDITVQEQGKPVVYFDAISETDGLDLTATVEIKGLPANCQNVFSESFRITFSVGTPLELEDYGSIVFLKEKAKLDNIAARYKALNESAENPILYFINYLPKLDEKTNRLLTNREAKIRDYLTQKHKISKENVVFVRGEGEKYRTKVLVVPAQTK